MAVTDLLYHPGAGKFLSLASRVFLAPARRSGSGGVMERYNDHPVPLDGDAGALRLGPTPRALLTVFAWRVTVFLTGVV